MFKQLKGQKGFTLIELMIVVAIIGILAAIAIPNFLQYQMKSRQAEAKTNLQAIRTSEIAFQAERGCYISAAPEGAIAVTAAKTVPAPWGLGLGPSAAATVWCTTTNNGNFRDIGFVATGNVFYHYIAEAKALAAPVAVAVSCPLAITGLSGVANLVVQANFIASAQANLDGDAVPAGMSTWASANDHGATDCTTGVF